VPTQKRPYDDDDDHDEDEDEDEDDDDDAVAEEATVAASATCNMAHPKCS